MAADVHATLESWIRDGDLALRLAGDGESWRCLGWPTMLPE
jgi:hypothetical protein